MDKLYNPAIILKKNQCYNSQTIGFIPKFNKRVYCVMAPPPNITGELHMGHALQYTFIDILIRYNKIRTINTFCQWGTDHSGIAAQLIIEKDLSNKSIVLNKLSKDNLLNYAWGWNKFSNSLIKNQLHKIGIFIDWTKECFTMDKNLSNSVIIAFTKLYKNGLIYRGDKIVNWDSVLCSAISDLEVGYKLTINKTWDIKYYILNSNKFLIVSTTRPETIIADIAVAFNAQDQRHKCYINKILVLPFLNRFIPVITDNYIDMKFGTGCLKITPGHDFADYDISKKYLLPKISVHCNSLNYYTPCVFYNLNTYHLRYNVIKYLNSNHMIIKSRDYIANIPISNRTNILVDFILTNQWFLRIKKISQPAIQSIISKQTNILPKNWKQYYLKWMHGLHDWCISRQLWWGHKIPVWYNKNNYYLGLSISEIAKCYNIENLLLYKHQDVLDTWFSSAVWPFSTLGWPSITFEFKNFYPFNILITGFDIISFWVSRMIMFGIHFTGNSPFNEIYIHGLIQDSSGNKMSKTKGNTIDPIDIINGLKLDFLINKKIKHLIHRCTINKLVNIIKNNYSKGINMYGVDALRLGLCSFNQKSHYIKFDFGVIDNYYNFCNKIWNMSYYVLCSTYIDLWLYKYNKKIFFFSSADKYILSAWQNTKTCIINGILQYKFNLIIKHIYDFLYNDFCSWYIEITKIIFHNKYLNPKIITTVKYNLIMIMTEIIGVLNVIVPNMANNLWVNLKIFKYINVLNFKFPKPDLYFLNFCTEYEFLFIKKFISKIRNKSGLSFLSINHNRLIILKIIDRKYSYLFIKYSNIILKLSKIRYINLTTHCLFFNRQVFFSFKQLLFFIIC